MANTNQIIINTALFIILVAAVLICTYQGGALENFIVLIDEVEIPQQCPDYLTTDGAKYYLVWNNKPFDGATNPLTFNRLASALDWLNTNKCPPLEPISLTRVTNPADPTISYERECNKQTANPNYWVNRCAFNKIFESQESLDEINNASTSDGTSDGSHELNTNSDNKLLDGYVPKLGSDTYGYLRKINNALATMDTNELVNYDVETCMFDKLSKDMPGLGSSDGLQRFRKYYNQQSDNNITRKPGQNEADIILTPNSLAEFDKYFQTANDLSITNDMMVKLFGKPEKI